MPLVGNYGTKKYMGQIEFVPKVCSKKHNCLKYSILYRQEHWDGTNSICPMFYFFAIISFIKERNRVKVSFIGETFWRSPYLHTGNICKTQTSRGLFWSISILAVYQN